MDGVSSWVKDDGSCQQEDSWETCKFDFDAARVCLELWQIETS